MEHIKSNLEIDRLKLKANKVHLRRILADLEFEKRVIILTPSDFDLDFPEEDLGNFEF